MATKTTTTYSVSVKVHGNDTPVTISDSHEAYAALMDFKAGNTIKFTANNATVYVPFHAIEMMTVTATSTSSTIKDDFCVED